MMRDQNRSQEQKMPRLEQLDEETVAELAVESGLDQATLGAACRYSLEELHEMMGIVGRIEQCLAVVKYRKELVGAEEKLQQRQQAKEEQLKRARQRRGLAG